MIKEGCEEVTVVADADGVAAAAVPPVGVMAAVGLVPAGTRFDVTDRCPDRFLKTVRVLDLKALFP